MMEEIVAVIFEAVPSTLRLPCKYLVNYLDKKYHFGLLVESRLRTSTKYIRKILSIDMSPPCYFDGNLYQPFTSMSFPLQYQFVVFETGESSNSRSSKSQGLFI